MVTKSAWKTPPGARPNRGGNVFKLLKTKFRKKIIKNFQRKYRQKRVDGVLDLETLKISEILAKKANIT